MSKRAAMRAKRLREQRRNRILTITIIAAAVLGIAWIIVWPIIKPVEPFEIPDLKPRPLADGRAMGDPDAPVVIEVFEDFQCGGCGYFSQTVAMQVAEDYVADGHVYYIFRHLPFIDDLAAGSDSDNAANASMCAAEQDAFWEYHDILFTNFTSSNSGDFSQKRLYAFAEAIGLDLEAFQECFRSERTQSVIDEDILRAQQLGVDFTPAVFVNDRIVVPNAVPTFEQLSLAILEILASVDDP